MENDSAPRPRAWIGFDNGISGAFAVIDNDKNLVTVKRFKTKVVAKKDHIDAGWLYHEIKPLIEKYRLSAVSEVPAAQQGGPGGQRTNSNAIMSTGISFGRILTVLDVLEIPFVTKTPSQWMPEFWTRDAGNDPKVLSINMAFQLYSESKPLVTNNGSRKPDHNSTDALLLAEYGRRKNL